MPIPITAAFDHVWTATGTSPALWTTAGNWSPSGPPGSGDDILIPAGTAPIDCTSMTSNVLYGSLVVQRGFNYPIGSSGAPLTGAFGQILHEGNGLITFVGTVGSGADTTPLITVASGRGNAPAMSIDGSAIDYVKVLRGGVTLEASMATLALLDIDHIGDRAGDSVVFALGNSNAITKVRQNAGRLVSARLLTLLEQAAGATCIQQAGQAITEANIGGMLNYQSESTATTFRVDGGGTLDPSTGRQGIVTCTTLHLAPRSTFYEDPRFVITNMRDARYMTRA